jgi:hypothetical protein
VIVVIQSKGAISAAQERRNPPFDMNQLPAFRAFSDIMYAEWAYTASQGAHVNYLRWIFMLNIQNVDTNHIIRRALDSKRETLKLYPGVYFSTGEEAGQALLGTLTQQLYLHKHI